MPGLESSLIIPYTCRDLNIRGRRFREEFAGILAKQELAAGDKFLGSPGLSSVNKQLAAVRDLLKAYADDSSFILMNQDPDECRYLF